MSWIQMVIGAVLGVGIGVSVLHWRQTSWLRKDNVRLRALIDDQVAERMRWQTFGTKAAVCLQHHYGWSVHWDYLELESPEKDRNPA